MGRHARTEQQADPVDPYLAIDWEEDLVGPSRARDVLSSIGWLSRQPATFQDEVFRRSVPVQYATGDIVYRLGDKPGGIYGIVSGALIATSSHSADPDGWWSEACPLKPLLTLPANVTVASNCPCPRAVPPPRTSAAR